MGTKKAAGLDRKRVSSPVGPQSPPLQLVTFEIAGAQCAVDLLCVQEINRIMEMTPTRNAADLQGVINLRGRTVPVINLRRRLGLAFEPPGTDGRILIVEVASRLSGFIVDRVNEVLRTSVTLVKTPDQIGLPIAPHFIRGVSRLNDRILVLLDCSMLIDPLVQENADFSAA